MVAGATPAADAMKAGKVMLSKLKDSRVVINCYEPGQSDEMHCHPGSEHTFLVWRGKLHVRGIAPGEELTLGPGDFVQIKAGYYYQLHNPGPDQLLLYQVKQPGELVSVEGKGILNPGDYYSKKREDQADLSGFVEPVEPIKPGDRKKS